MKKFNLKIFTIAFAIFNFLVIDSRAVDSPIATDSRIKTFVYSQNEVFKITVHYGYQTSIEFADGETIQTISVGNNYAWQLLPMGGRLFIKPLEDNVLTNMTIITNKRTYQFEVQSKPASYAQDDELVYVVRFFFPDNSKDIIKPNLTENSTKKEKAIPVIKPYNFNYIVTGAVRFAPAKVFDDGVKTFFYFDKNLDYQPVIYSIKDNKKEKIDAKSVNDYLVINLIAKQFELNFKGQVIEIINENYINEE